MKQKNRFFGRILCADKDLLNFDETNFAIRQRTEQEITLVSLNGKIVRLLAKGRDVGPDCIGCELLPPLDENIAEDGWVLHDGVLRIPFLTLIELKKTELFDSVANIEIRDFPGHMRGLIARRMRQADFATFRTVEDRVGLLAAAINERLTESAEIPLVDLVGFGEGNLAMGDAAICGLLLTGRGFALGKRFKVDWYSRLRVEIKRLVHRTDARGKSWLGFAQEGKMTGLQRRFFEGMARDFECADEILVNEISNSEEFNGRAFLIGCFTALEMVQKNLFKK